MTKSVPINGLSLTLNSPIDQGRLDRIVADLSSARPQRVVDLGCGWGEVLFRVLEAVPGAAGVGIDLEAVDIERGREAAESRGLADRVRLEVGDASTHRGSYDLALSIGAHHALDPDVGRALAALRGLVVDGGRLLFGVDYWQSEPPAERLKLMWGGASLAESRLLGEVVEAAAATGWRLLDLHEVSQSEWDAYECGLVRNQEEWLLANPGHPDAEALRHRLDEGRREWFTGHHGYLGFAWLTLGALAIPS